jgi:hypothetical protein
MHKLCPEVTLQTDIRTLSNFVPDSGKFLKRYAPSKASKAEFPPHYIRAWFQFGANSDHRAKPGE